MPMRGGEAMSEEAVKVARVTGKAEAAATGIRRRVR